MFVVNFANFKSPALSRDSSSDRMMPRAEVRFRVRASHGNITVLSHFLRWLTRVLMEYKSTTFNSFEKGSKLFFPIYCLLKSFTILCEM